MPGAVDFHIRPFEEQDEQEVLELLQGSLGGGPFGRRTVRFFRWKHRDNPFGTSPAYVAEAGGTIVGFRTFLRWRWRTAAGVHEAVRAVDTATHPGHRGAGIFTRLTVEAVESLRQADLDLIFNTPNTQSRPGYLKMGWTQVGTVPVAIRAVRPVRFAAGLARLGAPPSDEPVPCELETAAGVLADTGAVTELLARTVAPDDRLSTDRTAAYLRWRYADAPDLDYRVAVATQGRRLTGLALGRPRRRGLLGEFTLDELLVETGDVSTARALLRAVAGSGCDHVAAITGHDPDLRAAWRAAGFLTFPGKGMILTARPLRAMPADPRSLSSWRLSLGDLELF
ncbi:hypothetical protein BH20ACT2_BH20ACT2_08680 [soil metagenome]